MEGSVVFRVQVYLFWIWSREGVPGWFSRYPLKEHPSLQLRVASKGVISLPGVSVSLQTWGISMTPSFLRTDTTYEGS